MVTPLGCGVDYNWRKLIQGVSGASKITRFNAGDYKCKVACEVPLGDGSNGTFNAENWIEKKEIKKIDDFIKYSLASTDEAFKNASLISFDSLQSEDIVIVSTLRVFVAFFIFSPAIGFPKPSLK